MANKIILKKTSTASKVPLSSDLEIGEIAVNLADQKLYSKNASGTVILVGSGISGAGDVQGPASSTDNALARFDSTTGKVIQNGNITEDDNGNLANVNALSFDTTPTSLPTTAGSMYWDDGNKTPTVVIDADVALQLGQEMLALVYNGTGSTIPNGSVVAVSGAQGQRPSVVLADADSESLSAPTLGIATEDIANGAEGFVTTFGFVRGLDTSAFTAGAPIYLSQTAGQFTATRPSAPAHTVSLGWVIKVNASSGEVFVNINNGWELDELHNVLITSPISGNTLIYDAVAGVWENASISAGTGISVTNGAGSITIANTGVTSVSGTAPISSSGGATPSISISQATTSTNGYLSSTDWNTFNGKQATLISGTNIKTVNSTSLLGSGNLAVGTVTSVSGTAPISVATGTSTPAISISQATTSTNGYLSSTDWNTFNGKYSTGGALGTPASGTLTNCTGYTYANLSGTVPTWNQNTTGNAATATTATTASTANALNTANNYQVTNLTPTGTIYSGTGNDYNRPNWLTIGTDTNWTFGCGSDNSTYYFMQAKFYGNSTNNRGFRVLNAANSSAVFLANDVGAQVNGNIVLHASNYNSYAPTLTGGGASGSWGISISGNAATATSAGNADTLDGNHASAFYLASNPSGYTSNTGTVTSVGGTGTVSGLTLTGTVTTSGSLTLGGNLTIAADMIYNSFTATASQTTFTTTNTYTSGKIDVYANGIRMVNGSDVTVTSGTSVVFASGLAVGTRVDLVYPI